jgi:prepilin-type N-terminal cleavage/methylation domain-containing protein
MPNPQFLSTPNAEQGFTLIELLVAMTIAIVVMLALFTILDFSMNQEGRISERVQADRIGRKAMTNVVDELHSSCTGFGATAIQAPSTTPTAPLEKIGPLNLWFISAYGSSSSASAVETKVYEHDIHWASTGKSNTGETLGTLTDYAFESTAGSGPGTKSGAWEFPALEIAHAQAHVLAQNVIPPTVSSANTIFQYYKLSSTSGEFVAIAAGAVPTAATANEVAKVTINFTQAPEAGSTKLGGRTVPFSDAVVLRFNATETGSEAEDEPCT